MVGRCCPGLRALDDPIDDGINLGRCTARCINDEAAAPACDPAVLIKVVQFAWPRAPQGATDDRIPGTTCL